MADLTLSGVAKNFGSERVLDGIDLVVPDGGLTSALGSSGSGKTTLLRLIMGFLRPDSGRIALGTTLLSEARVHRAPEKRGIGYVAQEGALFPHLSVGENVGFGLPRAQRRSSARIDEVLELVGLDADYARRRPFEISGGEQRRVALARALAPQPAVILLDEPFSGLDAALRAETGRAVVQALKLSKTTALLVTHDQAEALSLSDQVAVLRAGRIAQAGRPQDIYEKPASLDIACFVGEATLIAGSAGGGHVHCALGELATESDIQGEVVVMIRPEQFVIASAAASKAVTARIVAMTYVGGECQATLQLNNDVSVAARTSSYAGHNVGSDVALAVQGPVMIYADNRVLPKRLIKT